MTDIDKINTALDYTNDALTRVYQKGSVDFSRIKDIRGSIARLKVGSSLNALELLNISMLLECAAYIKGYYEQRADSIQPLIDMLDPVTLLNNAIKKCIISEDEISDDASANLRSIRRQKNIAADRIHTELNKILNSPSTRTYLQDYVITTRQGRFCLPVKAEYKSLMPGMVHDQSSTGSTVFIEPAAVVKLNNDIRELELKEQAEIEVILADLSAKAAEHTDSLLSDYDILTNLDCIFAKALLSRHFNCSRPVMNNKGIVNIKKGQFLSPLAMRFAAEKVVEAGNKEVMITERGTTFGYQDLVVDYRGIPEMQTFGYPVILDVTHSLQQPNQTSGVTGGMPQLIETVAKAGIAVGADGLFIETHEHPEIAKSDGANMLKLDLLEGLLTKLVRIREAIKE